MKKITALLLICLMCISCFSCAENEPDEDSSEDVSDTEEIPDDTDTPDIPDTGDTVVSDGFRTYTLDDFKEINVTLNYTSDKAPVVCYGIKNSDHDFGKRLSPCKQTEDPSQFDPFSGISGTVYWIDDDGVEHTLENSYMQLLDTPEQGVVTNAVYADGKVYFVVSYDNYCLYCHDWSIYEFEVDDYSFREVYHFFDVDDKGTYGGVYGTKSYRNTLEFIKERGISGSVYGIPAAPVIVDNKLFLTYCNYDSDGNEEGCQVVSVDIDTGEEKLIYESDHTVSIIGGKYSIQIRETDEIDNDRFRLTLMEYIPETGKLRTITENEETKLYDSALTDANAYIRKPLDGRRCEFVTENYCIKTDLTDANVVYASDKKAIMATVGYKLIMHTFDLEKMEHYITDFGAKTGQLEAYGENVIFCDSQLINNTDSTFYYIIPELGLAFTVFEGAFVDWLISSSGTVTFSQLDSRMYFVNDSYDDKSIVKSFENIKSVHWIEDRE